MKKTAEYLQPVVQSLSRVWRTLAYGHPQGNPDGTITNRFGHRIIPYQVSVTGNGGLSSNLTRFMVQPRVRDLLGQMEPVLREPHGIGLFLDKDGQFYLSADGNRPLPGKPALGQIDTAVEQSLYKHAQTLIIMRKMFGDCSHDNPIVLSEDGRVYPKNRPWEVRGRVDTGQSVPGPAAHRLRRD